MDNNEMREELGKIVGKLHASAHHAVYTCGAGVDGHFLKGVARGYETAASMIVDLIREMDEAEDRSLMDQAQYEKSEKDCLWERD